MDDWSKRTVVVTGGCGMIGSHLLDELAARGCEHFLVYDDLSRGSLRNIQAHLAAGRIELNAHDLVAVVPIFPPNVDAVFHLAARVTSIEENRHDHWGMLTRNLRINLNVAEAARIARPKLFVGVSTACVYPHDAPVPTPESYGEVCNPEPTNHGYGVAKFVLEQQVKYLCREHGIPAFSVRFFNAISPWRDYYDEATSHVAPALIRRVCQGEEPLTVWGTGTQSRVLVDARDLARALVDLAACEAAHDARPVNIGHEQEITIGDLALLICHLAGWENPVVYFDHSKPDGYPRRAADTTRLRELIGWVPSTPLAETLAAMIATYRGAHDPLAYPS